MNNDRRGKVSEKKNPFLFIIIIRDVSFRYQIIKSWGICRDGGEELEGKKGAKYVIRLKVAFNLMNISKDF